MSRKRRRRSANRPPWRRGDWVAMIAAALVVVAVGIWAAVRLTDNDDVAPLDATDELGVEHVHGLGVNPADGSLIVATHFGSFRIAADSDEAERIGASLQDTMGFTVAGPDHFLGSGHPDLEASRQGQPGRLGLIESTDAGATWTALSLSGEVDFHGLAFAHDQVYGWDSGSGKFMVSADRTTWETRSTLDLFGFAVDPADPARVVAATPTGLSESADGGRAWASTDGPTLVAVSWDVEAGLWGADAAGAVWHHTGAAWEQAGPLPGEPQALLATTDVLYAAAHDAAGVTGIYRSTDDGATWQLRYRDGEL